MDGVVSVRSFELLVQWLYLGRVNFDVLTPDEDISTTIEFSRLADMCGITGMESLMAERIKAIIIANPAPSSTKFTYTREPDTNTYCLTSWHITSAANLPGGHPVRSALAMAAVEGYFRRDNHKFLRETQEVPSFSVDLVRLEHIAASSPGTLQRLKKAQRKNSFIFSCLISSADAPENHFFKHASGSGIFLLYNSNSSCCSILERTGGCKALR